MLPSLHRRALLAATLALVISGCGGESDSTAPSPNSTAPADTGTTATPNTPSEPDPVPGANLP